DEPRAAHQRPDLSQQGLARGVWRTARTVGSGHEPLRAIRRAAFQQVRDLQHDVREQPWEPATDKPPGSDAASIDRSVLLHFDVGPCEKGAYNTVPGAPGIK